MRTAPWILAAIVACLVAATQTVRMRSSGTTVLALSQEVALLRALKGAHEHNVLTLIRNDLATGGAGIQFERDAIIMIADTKCGACATALQAIAERMSSRPVMVASFVDEADELGDWLQLLGADLPVLSVNPDSTALRWLPRRITPLYLEFEGFDPAAVHAGQPKDYWLTSSGGSMTR